MITDKDVRAPPRVGSEPPNNFSRIRHVELGRGIVKKHPIPPRRPVYTAAKVSMAGFTVSGLENEISYIQQDWPLVVLKVGHETGDRDHLCRSCSYCWEFVATQSCAVAPAE